MTSQFARFTTRATALLQRLLDQLRQCFPAVPAAYWPAMGMLALASAAACALWALRVLFQEHLHHVFLPWNLFLAWLPLLFALATLHLGQRHGWRSWKPWFAGGAWLIFFPNAPYIFTDLIHLRPVRDHRFWMDLVMILLFAWPGFLVGCLSLKILHAPVAQRFGFAAGWLFAGSACGLAGIGVYIGRFLRWNSWDIVTNPLRLSFDLLGFIGHPPTHPAYRFSILFGLLFFIGYVTSHSPTTLPKNE